MFLSWYAALRTDLGYSTAYRQLARRVPNYRLWQSIMGPQRKMPQSSDSSSIYPSMFLRHRFDRGATQLIRPTSPCNVSTNGRLCQSSDTGWANLTYFRVSMLGRSSRAAINTLGNLAINLLGFFPSPWHSCSHQHIGRFAVKNADAMPARGRSARTCRTARIAGWEQWASYSSSLAPSRA